MQAETHRIKYYSKSDGKRVSRPYNPNSDMQYEFVAKSTGNLCKRYWDAEKVTGEQRLWKKSYPLNL